MSRKRLVINTKCLTFIVCKFLLLCGIRRMPLTEILLTAFVRKPPVFSTVDLPPLCQNYCTFYAWKTEELDPSRPTVVAA